MTVQFDRHTARTPTKRQAEIAKCENLNTKTSMDLNAVPPKERLELVKVNGG